MFSLKNGHSLHKYFRFLCTQKFSGAQVLHCHLYLPCVQYRDPQPGHTVQLPIVFMWAQRFVQFSHLYLLHVCIHTGLRIGVGTTIWAFFCSLATRLASALAYDLASLFAIIASHAASFSIYKACYTNLYRYVLILLLWESSFFSKPVRRYTASLS